jgi:hypothetical protein
MIATPRYNPQGYLGAAYLSWNDASGAAMQMIFDCVEEEDWEDGADVTEHPVEVGTNVTDNVRVRTSKVTLKVFATNHPLGANNTDDFVPTTISLSIGAPASVANVASPLQVSRWQSNLELRAAIGAAAGLVGAAVGSIAGVAGAGGAAGALAGSAIAGALLNGQKVYALVPTSAGPGAPRQPKTLTAQVFAMADPDDYVSQVVQQLLMLKDAAQLFTVQGTKQSCANMVITELTVHADSETGAGRALSLGLSELRFVSTTTVAAPAPAYPRASTPVSVGNQQTEDDDSDAQSVLYTALHGLPAPAGG